MAKDSTGQIRQLLEAIIREALPELNGFQFPLKARVTKLHERAGKVGEYQKIYSVDVQPLKADGSIDETKPVIPDVPIDVHWAGSQRGILCIPPKGAVVRIGFYYWDPAMPYIDGVIGDGYGVPEHPDGGLVIQQKDGVFFRIKPSGDIEVETDKEIKLTAGSSKALLEPAGSVKIESTTDIQLNCGAARMMLKTSGEMNVEGTIAFAGGGPAVARVGDSVRCSCGTGIITSGSSKVNCGG